MNSSVSDERLVFSAGVVTGLCSSTGPIRGAVQLNVPGNILCYSPGAWLMVAWPKFSLSTWQDMRGTQRVWKVSGRQMVFSGVTNTGRCFCKQEAYTLWVQMTGLVTTGSSGWGHNSQPRRNHVPHKMQTQPSGWPESWTWDSFFRLWNSCSN